MRTSLRQLCAMIALSLVLSVSALADGDIGVGRSGDIGVGRSATGDIGVGKSATGDIGVGRQLLLLLESVLRGIY